MTDAETARYNRLAVALTKAEAALEILRQDNAELLRAMNHIQVIAAALATNEHK